MKICWDNLERVRFSQRTGKFYSLSGFVTYMEFPSCSVCGDPFLDRVYADRPKRCCSVECKRLDPDFRSARSQLSAQAWTDTQFREKVASAHRAATSTKEFSDKMKAAAKECCSRPEFIEKRRAATKRRWEEGSFRSTNPAADLNPMWDGGYNKRRLAKFDVYSPQLSPIEETRRSPDDENVLQIMCVYCGRWHTPTLSQVWNRRNYIVGTSTKESRFYCSDRCKAECPIFAKQRYRKGQKGKEKSEEAHPAVRKMCFERDGWICQKCGATEPLHAHHILPRAESAISVQDLDNLITICSSCHENAHRIPGCGYHEIPCK